MEVEGAKRIFERSILKRKLRYTEFYGDGDSKSHPAVKDTYPGVIVKKLECVGHVQKRVGTRLRNLKKNCKGFGGKGKLTNDIIDRLQNYYGIAVRQNKNDLQGMKKAILATLFHVASSDKNNYHTAYCPPGANSWCRFRKDSTTYKSGPGLPIKIIAALKPIYNDLSADDLLSKCLHGKTRNQNESFNATIWERLPKSKYSSFQQLEFGVYDAAAHFNIGQKASILVYEKLNMVPGKYTLKGCATRNKKRLFHAAYKNKDVSKKRRKVIRGKKKKKEDKDEDREGILYDAGAF